VIEHGDGTKTPVIDASVHIFMQSNKDLRKNFMAEPYRSRGFPDYEMDWYQAPGGEYVKGAAASGYPSSDPAVVAEELFNKLTFTAWPFVALLACLAAVGGSITTLATLRRMHP